MGSLELVVQLLTQFGSGQSFYIQVQFCGTKAVTSALSLKDMVKIFWPTKVTKNIATKVKNYQLQTTARRRKQMGLILNVFQF